MKNVKHLKKGVIEEEKKDHNDETTLLPIVSSNKPDNFAIIFAAMGVTMETARFFKQDFEENASMENVTYSTHLVTSDTISGLPLPQHGQRPNVRFSLIL